jgi:hypothetical protein
MCQQGRSSFIMGVTDRDGKGRLAHLYQVYQATFN